MLLSCLNKAFIHTCTAPSYANIFMASLENQMLLHQPHNLSPFIWLCYIFMLWTHGPSSPTTFLQYINTFHPTIKFSHQQSHTSINFSNTTILFTTQRTLQSTLYIKTHQQKPTTPPLLSPPHSL